MSKPNAIQDISDFDGDGTVFRFQADFRGGSPELVIEADGGTTVARLILSPRDLGEFEAALVAARKDLLRRWMEFQRQA